MPTGDGLLVRLLPISPMPLAAFIGLCKAAQRHGNGTMEISARGSVQVRGLTGASAPAFATEIAALEIESAPGLAIVAGPLDAAADALVPTAPIAHEVRRAAAAAGLTLAPKTCVVIDAGGAGLHLDALSADVRLLAVATPDGLRFIAGIAGDGVCTTWLGAIAPADAAGVIVALLGILAESGPTARAADVLSSRGTAAFRNAMIRAAEHGVIAPGESIVTRRAAIPLGQHALRDGAVALGIALPFGHAHADKLAKLVERAAAHGVHAVAPLFGRVLMLIGVRGQAVAELLRAAESLGFVTRADDVRRRIVACPGAPACAAGVIPARAIAEALGFALEGEVHHGGLAAAGAKSPSGVAIHVSGCTKGCAHRASAPVTAVGIPHGCGISRNASPGGIPQRFVHRTDVAGIVATTLEALREAGNG